MTTLLGDPPDSGPFGPTPPSTRFSLYGPARAPKTGTVELMRVEDVMKLEFEARQLDAFKTLLADRPPLADGANGSPDEIPLLVDEGAAQGVRGQAVYVDTDDVSGVLFVTAFIQNAYPFSSGSFSVIFEGLSADGTMAVHASFPVVAGGFPRVITPELAGRVQTDDGWTKYVRNVVRRLDRATPDAFTPSLGSLGALVASMRFEDVVSPEP